jgi:hypothetical protein
MAQIYAQMFLLIDGQLLGECSSVEVNIEDTSPEVLTLAHQGTRGKTPGPKRLTISSRHFIPAAGVEYEFSNDLIKNRFVNAKIQRTDNNKSLASEGWFTASSLSTAVVENLSYSFDFNGEPAEWT